MSTDPLSAGRRLVVRLAAVVGVGFDACRVNASDGEAARVPAQADPQPHQPLPADQGAEVAVARGDLGKGAEKDLSVGPRGACGVVDKHIRCVGAIRTPSVEVSQVKVSPGVQASACGIAGTKVLCWGEGYSPAGNPGLAVPIEFAATQPPTAVVDFPPPAGTEWPKNHLIHQGCSEATVPLPRCPPGTTGKPWSALASESAALKGKTVSVRDRLLVAPIAWEETTWHTRGNDDTFEYHTRPLVLGEGDAPLRLWGDRPRFVCGGDASRLCCRTQAFGQIVVATGVLDGSRSNGWSLRSAEVCEVPSGGN